MTRRNKSERANVGGIVLPNRDTRVTAIWCRMEFFGTLAQDEILAAADALDDAGFHAVAVALSVMSADEREDMPQGWCFPHWSTVFHYYRSRDQTFGICGYGQRYTGQRLSENVNESRKCKRCLKRLAKEAA